MKTKIDMEQDMRKALDQRILSLKTDKLSQLCNKEFATKLKAYVRMIADDDHIRKMHERFVQKNQKSMINLINTDIKKSDSIEQVIRQATKVNKRISSMKMPSVEDVEKLI